MLDVQLGAVESRFADIIWENAPISSGMLVKLCQEELSWKKPTTYTVLRKLCEKGIFENRDGTVVVRITREEFYALQTEQFVEEEYPEIEFCHATGTTAMTAGLENFHNYFAAIYEARYVSGVVGGMKLQQLIDDQKKEEENG